MWENFEYYLQRKMRRMLLKPFRYWYAFTMGIIDEDGNKLREPETADEKRRYNVFDELIRRIIKLFMKYTPNAKGMARFKMFKEFLADGFIKVLDEQNGDNISNAELEAEYWVKCYIERINNDASK